MTLKSLAACSVIVAGLVGGTGRGAEEAQGATEPALVRLENRWVAALVKGDTTALDSILADRYVDTDEEGHRSDKHGVLAAFQSGDLKMTAITLSDMHVYAYGSFAVVTGTADQAGAWQGHPLTPRIVFTDSFILKDGKWYPIASQRTAVH